MPKISRVSGTLHRTDARCYQLNCVTCALSLLSSFAFSILKVAVLSAAAAAVDVAVYNPNSNELL